MAAQIITIAIEKGGAGKTVTASNPVSYTHLTLPTTSRV